MVYQTSCWTGGATSFQLIVQLDGTVAIDRTETLEPGARFTTDFTY